MKSHTIVIERVANGFVVTPRGIPGDGFTGGPTHVFNRLSDLADSLPQFFDPPVGPIASCADILSPNKEAAPFVHPKPIILRETASEVQQRAKVEEGLRDARDAEDVRRTLNRPKVESAGGSRAEGAGS